MHESTQDAFGQDEWSLATPAVNIILKKYAEMGQLSGEAQLRQGMNTGADATFIIPEPSLRQFDAELFVPLLSDREMEAFTVPSAVQSFVFYPYVGDVLLTETQLSDRFPRTWEFLQSHRVTLERRSAVRKVLSLGENPNGHGSQNMLRPKIVTPHLVIAPKFGLDPHGRYGVSRAPIIFSKFTEAGRKDHLIYLLGILNSTACFWHIAHRAYVYEHGYSRLELARLRGTAYLPSRAWIRAPRGD